jgi:hypothetical protein
MKLKLDPAISYVIGYWAKRRTDDGIGVESQHDDILGMFVKCALELKMTTPEKMLNGPGRVFFYNSKYKKFFNEIYEDRLERYKYINDYSASFLAGMFDSVGSIDSEKGILYMEYLNDADCQHLFRLGFPVRRMGSRIAIGRAKVFIALIRNYTKRFAQHPAMLAKNKAADKDEKPETPQESAGVEKKPKAEKKVVADEVQDNKQP